MSYSSDNLSLAEKVRKAVEDGDFLCASSLVNENQYYEEFKKSSSEILPSVTNHITAERKENDMNNYKYCYDIINRIAEVCNPEETLLQFIEEVEESDDDIQFGSLLFPMQKVLQRIRENLLNSISWSLNSIQTYLNKIDFSKNSHKKSNSCNEITIRIEFLYREIIKYYNSIITLYARNLKSNKEFGTVFSKHLIELLGPFGYLDLSSGDKTSKIIENLVEKILLIQRDPFVIFNLDNSFFLKPTEFSYGIFLYLIMSEKLQHEMIPKIYNNCYIFSSSLFYIITVLKSESQLVIEKGLNLAESILNNHLQLSYLVLELEVNKDFVKILENIIIFNEFEECRKQGLRIFEFYINSFEVKGRYLLLYNLVRTIQHSGLAGFVIVQYKETLVKLQRTQNKNVDLFQGNKLYSFINQCVVLSTEDEYNLMNEADRIVCLINLMRFVVVQEKPQNIGSFLKIVKIWKNIFFDPLVTLIGKGRNCIALMKTKHVTNCHCVNERNVNVCLGGGTPLEVPDSEKLMNIELSLTGFDMIESLLNRLIELLKSKNCYD